jgi:serine/threonine protein kinase
MSAEVTTPSGMVGTGTATPILSSNALPIGTRVHEFEITRVVGEGGFSVVYLAFDHTLHRSIALKEYIPSALASRRGDNTVAVRSAQHQQTFEAGLRSFINEARLLAQFDHPALVKVYRFWESNGTAYMAMPYYDGRTLKQILRDHPDQATQEWLERLLVPLLDALELLHRHRCYHRDIAPDNIQVLENEAPVLLDFGAARRTIGDMTQAFTVILKPGYAPIEQYADEADLKQGPWTDVYALSAVLYGAIVRKPPPTAVARVIKDPLDPLAKRALPGYSAAFLSGIDRGLAVRPEDRPQSIAEWRTLMGMQKGAADATELRWRGVGVSPLDADSRRMPEPHREPHAAAPGSVAPQTSASEAKAHASFVDDNTGPPPAPPEAAAVASAASEQDRTVLVPGLRGPARHHRTEAATAGVGTALERGASRERVPMLRRPQTLIGIGLLAAALTAIVAIGLWRADNGDTIVDDSVVAKAGLPAETTPSTPRAPESQPLPSPGSPQPKDASSAGSVPSPGATRPAVSPPTASSQESPPKDVAPAPLPTSPPPVVSDDEKEWARIRNSGKLADFLAFQLNFPSSSHSADAAGRISALERRAQEAARQPPSKPAPRPKPGPQVANADEAKRPPKVAPQPAAAGQTPAAQPPVAATPAVVEQRPAAAPAPAAKAVVRIHAQPFGYVYVDGALIGASPPVREVAMSPGRHRIEARNDAARPPVVSREIDISGSEARDVRLRFDE